MNTKLIGICLLVVAIGCAAYLMLRKPAGPEAGPPTVAGVEHATDAGKVSASGGQDYWLLTRSHLAVEYPSQVVIGSSVDINITVSQTRFRAGEASFGAFKVGGSFKKELTELMYPVQVSLSSGSLDWTSVEQTRVFGAGTPLPFKVGWSPGTKATGTATVYLKMTRAKPDEYQVFLTVNNAPLEGGANDEVPLKINVLNKYSMSDTLFHWLALIGSVASFFGATLLLGWLERILELLGIRKKPAVAQAPPARRTRR